MIDFGTKFRILRESRGITQQEVADYLGINRATISHYESSASYPSIEILMKIAQYFNASTDYLLGLSDDPRLEMDGLTDDQMALMLEMARQYQILNNQVKNMRKQNE